MGLHVKYTDFGCTLPTEEEDREFAEEMGWTLEELRNAQKNGHGFPPEDTDRYIKEQRKKKYTDKAL